MGRAYSTNASVIVGVKPAGKKTHLPDLGVDGGIIQSRVARYDWIHQAQDMGRWWTFAKAVMSILCNSHCAYSYN